MARTRSYSCVRSRGGGRVQFVALVALLAALTGVATLAIFSTSAASRETKRATAAAALSDLLQDTRFYAADGSSKFEHYQHHHDQASLDGAVSANAAFNRSLALLPQDAGTAPITAAIRDKVTRATALATRAAALTVEGRPAEGARLNLRAEKLASSLIADLTAREETAHQTSAKELAQARRYVTELSLATPIGLLGVLLLALIIAFVLRRDRRAIATIAATDPLTGLPNRRALTAAVEASIGRHGRNERETTECSLLLLDLDRFKEVNDGLGHQFGDELLRAVGGRLQSTVAETDTVARIGGDEFVVLLRADACEAELAATRIRSTLCEPFTIEGVEVGIDVSIGVAVADHEYLTDASSLLRAADLAMYAAKQSGGAHLVYTPSSGPGSPTRSPSSAS